jgi:hypothetical protein
MILHKNGLFCCLSWFLITPHMLTLTMIPAPRTRQAQDFDNDVVNPVLWVSVLFLVAVLYVLTNHEFCSHFLCRLANPLANPNLKGHGFKAAGCTQYCKFSEADKKHCDTLMPSLLHAVISVTLASAHCVDCIIKSGTETLHVSSYTSTFSQAAIGFSSAYFVVDAAVVHHRRISGGIVVLHHHDGYGDGSRNTHWLRNPPDLPAVTERGHHPLHGRAVAAR